MSYSVPVVFRGCCQVLVQGHARAIDANKPLNYKMNADFTEPVNSGSALWEHMGSARSLSGRRHIFTGVKSSCVILDVGVF